MLFQYTDNPERELKLRNVQLLRRSTQLFSVNCLVDKRKLHKNRNTDNRRGIDSVETRQNWFVLTGILLVNGDELNFKILPKFSCRLYLVFLIRPFGASINKSFKKKI